MSQYMEAGIAR